MHREHLATTLSIPTCAEAGGWLSLMARPTAEPARGWTLKQLVVLFLVGSQFGLPAAVSVPGLQINV